MAIFVLWLLYCVLNDETQLWEEKLRERKEKQKKRGIRGHRFGLKSVRMSSHQILSQQGGTITALTRIMGEF